MRARRFAGGRRGWRHRLAGSGLLAAMLALAIPAATVAALTVGGGATGTGRPAVRSQSLTVTTADGAVFGRTAGPVDQWLGIPYAAPPSGRLRWAPPRPVTPWRGVRSALAYGNRCPQLADTNGPLTATMNCLNLNVSAPAVIPAGGKARTGAPEVPGQRAWPQDRGGRLMSLRPGGITTAASGTARARQRRPRPGRARHRARSPGYRAGRPG